VRDATGRDFPGQHPPSLGQAGPLGHLVPPMPPPQRPASPSTASASHWCRYRDINVKLMSLPGGQGRR